MIEVDTSIIYKKSNLTFYLKSDSVIIFNYTSHIHLTDVEFKPYAFIDSFASKNNHFVFCMDSSIIDFNLNDFVCDNSVISILIQLKENKVSEKSIITCSKINEVCSDRLKIHYLDTHKIHKNIYIGNREMIDYHYDDIDIGIKKAMMMKLKYLYDFKH